MTLIRYNANGTNIEKYYRKMWMPAVLEHLKMATRPLSYYEIVSGTKMLSIYPRKNLIQTRTCPTKKEFTRNMHYIEEVESHLDEQKIRFWRFIK